MPGITFPTRSFLIVDDHNFSRITVLRLLKNMGDPQTYSATNGIEALSLLEQRSHSIHCVIADFNMPIMHGLMLLKHIRTGYKNIQRNLPVLMLTGHSDSALVELAIQLDVNSFVLKPVTKKTLTDRLLRIFKTHDPQDDSNLKSTTEYEALDVDTRIRDILEHNAASQVEDSSINGSGQCEIISYNIMRININEAQPGLVLARPVCSKDGNQIFVVERIKLSYKHLETLRDLVDMGMIDPIITVSKPT
jgi:two-component system, chemotaxis family, chemotaxis protein CheY